MRSSAKDLAALWATIDDVTGGALYALRYECETNGWTPHLWAHTPAEGSPNGLTRLMFYGVDVLGEIVYWDVALVRDTTGMAAKIKLLETLQDAKRASERIQLGLSRLDAGLDPTPDTAEVRGLN